MNNNDYITISVIPITQTIGTFFIGKMTPSDLYSIANKNLSRVRNLEEGIQRELRESKLKEIRRYLGEKDATFPNTIILAIQNNPADSEPSFKLENDVLHILRSENVANVLDGQHRLFSFEKDRMDFELPVAIFLDMSLAEQAKIFATINSTQTKVDLTLVYDLFGITEKRTPEKVAFQLVRHLNTEPDSAWKGKIKTLTERNGDLAQGAMAKFFHKELLEKHPVFKDLFKNERDTDMKNILMNYFNAVRKAFPEEWDNRNNKRLILTKTTGFNGFMTFFVSLVKLASESKRPMSTEYFLSYINNVKMKFVEFTSENYESGAKGQNKIRDILRSGLSDQEKDLLNIK